MRLHNALHGYPEPKEPRYVSPSLRTIQHRIVATYKDERFYDGERIYGHGGLKYDGRWLPLAKNMVAEYGLGPGASILHLGAEKGFLLHDFRLVDPALDVWGLETTSYPIDHALPDVKDRIKLGEFDQLPFRDKQFDLVIAIGPVYTLNLTGAIKVLKEIERVGKGKSFITLASYDTHEAYWLFKYWTLLSGVILSEPEWLEVLRHSGFNGDYWFVNARSLKLILKED